MNDKELLEKLISTMERIEKAGTFQEFFQSVQPDHRFDSVSYPAITKDEGYKEIYDSCMFQCALHLNKADEELARAKHYVSYTTNMYLDYKKRRDSITNPDILKFIKDYEEAIGLGGEE